MNKRMSRLILSLALALSLSVAALADTIRLKDGSVIRGQVIAFNNQQFTVLVGAGSRGRRSQITLYMEDVESIEFESTGNQPLTSNDDPGNRPNIQTNTNRPPVQRPAPQNTQSEVDDIPMSQPTTARPTSSRWTSRASSRTSSAVPWESSVTSCPC